ncbi:hypothetical protein QF000_006645 [Paraburkholderia atlantica]|uniref:hypothetical protein n=1 Tax=Paraburkholderia atlantica TaxID=2654982 RepID=UPI003D24E8DA
MDEHFVVYSPECMAYWPPVTMDKAKDLIADRSTCAGEPGWNIVPLKLALGPDGALRNGREVRGPLARAA